MVYVFSTCDNEMFRYVFGALDEPVSIIVLPKSIENNYFARKLAHILWKFGIFIKYNFFGCEFNQFLCNIRPEDKVIFYARFPEHLFNVVPWLNSRVRVCLWMWDILDSIPFVKQKINIIKKLNIPIYTFDRKDAANYAIQYIPQLYNFKKPRNINEGNAGIQKCDVYFLGFPKDEYRMSWYKKPRRHNGIDIGIPQGTPIYSPVSGTAKIRFQKNGAGLYISIMSGGYQYLFMHLHNEQKPQNLNSLILLQTILPLQLNHNL